MGEIYERCRRWESKVTGDRGDEAEHQRNFYVSGEMTRWTDMPLIMKQWVS